MLLLVFNKYSCEHFEGTVFFLLLRNNMTGEM